jgi:MFS family permease
LCYGYRQSCVLPEAVVLKPEHVLGDFRRTAPSPAPDHGSLTRSEIRTLLLASLGGALEFYDFVIFVFFAVVIGKLFFPPDLPDWIRQLQTFGIFSAGYLARPLGGIVMAHFGDTRGRKRMFTLSVLLMAIPTFLIGFLPTYHSSGIAAPLLLLFMRITQGMAIGGEVPGGWVFVGEHAAPRRVGFAIGLLTSGLAGGILLGSLMAAIVSLVFSPPQIIAGAWRLPFLAGGLFGLFSVYLRRWLEETPVFEQMRMRAALSREIPLRAVLRMHKRATISAMISTWMLTAAIVVLILMTPALLQKLFALPAREVQLANLAATGGLVVSALLVGAATDKFGVRRVAMIALPILIAATYGLYLGAQRMPSALLPLYLLAGIGAGSVTVTPIMMVRAFPPHLRFSGLSFSYNVAYAVFGGITPVFVSWIAHLNPLSPAHYVSIVTLAGLLATLLAPSARTSEQISETEVEPSSA